MYYRDLREFLAQLERQGKVYRFNEPINKDTELVPIQRAMLRGVSEDERKVLIFEDVRGARGETYDMQVVAGAYGLSRDILVAGMGCDSFDQALERWYHALANPIQPIIVDEGPVQEVVHVGEELLEVGLDAIPAPIEEVGFAQVIRTGLPMVTRDPETRKANVGMYNGFFRDRTRICAGIGPGQDAMRYHWQTARRRGEELPIAIVVGGTPNLSYVASARMPYDYDELSVAGSIAGEPMQLVPCKTIPLEVPTTAEMVIEGYLSIDTLEPRMVFGEYPGFMQVENNNRPTMRVTGITHRKDPLFTTVLVGFPPSDSNVISSFVNSATLHYRLKYAARMPVAETHVSEMTGAAFCVIRLEKGANRQVWQVLQAAAGLNQTAKFIIAVDYDVNPRDPDLLVWALTWRVRPEMDIQLSPGRDPGLDPSFGQTGSSQGRMDQRDMKQYHRVMIDATMPGAYPPLALPKQEYMERAIQIWKLHDDLPELRLREPWYGYTLGHWSDEDQRIADLLITDGYRAVGEIAKTRQVPTEDVLGRG